MFCKFLVHISRWKRAREWETWDCTSDERRLFLVISFFIIWIVSSNDREESIDQRGLNIDFQKATSRNYVYISK